MKQTRRIAQPMKKATGVLLSVLIIACQQKPTPLPKRLNELPFQQLTDVQLGMPLRDLAAARQLTRTTNREYHETVASYDVVYEVKDDHLESVAVSEYDATGTAAAVRYTHYVREAFRSLGVQPVCRYNTARRQLVALYVFKGEVYELSYQAGDPDEASIVIRAFRLHPTVSWTTGSDQGCVR
jgi:hypothetical protein